MENSSIQPVEQSKPKNKKWLIFFAAGISGLVVIGAGLAIYAVYEIYVPVDRAGGQSQEFIIEKGLSVKEIGVQLKKANLVRSHFWFEAYIWCNKQSSALQAGRYALSQNLNIPGIVDMITGGKVLLNETRLTFPEGFTITQIKERLTEGGVGAAVLMGDEKIGDYQVQYKFLKDAPAQASLEGLLFPDTYIFEKDVKQEQIVKKFLDNFDKKLTPDLRAQISQQGKNLYDVIILASIVQQEAVNEEEMPLIAGVFAKRLNVGMALQSDATVNYVTGKKLRQPLLEDLKVQSSYNTYLHSGLPPGPICNPGIAAIRAAISPQPTDYLYFLHPLDKPTVFSKTLEEHNKNKAKWLK